MIICLTNAYPISVGSLEKADVILDTLRLTSGRDLSLTRTIFVSHSVDVFGQTYRTGSILPLRKDYRGDPLFGEVLHIFPQIENESILMFVEILNVKFFDEHFYAYSVQRSEAYESHIV